MSDHLSTSDRLIKLQGAMLAFEQVFDMVMASLGAGVTIDRKMFNEDIIDSIAARLRETRGELRDAEARKTFDAALRLLDDMRAGKARKPFKVIRGGKAD
jgi:hypothetical protein